MNKLFLIIGLLFMACTNNPSHVEATNEDEHEPHDTMTTNAASLQLNNGARWKTDEATRKNVAAMVRVVNDSTTMGKNSRTQLASNLQQRIDTLVQQCKMKGPDHDALHLWLERVLMDLKQLKEDDKEYQESYAALKKDVESFYTFFE
ncbi:MAG TPA: hypothetical protein VFP87_09715 [Chitinophagaceae bacterium]|nr:hypothetical protein [Chitinophagaceae bacterium]